MNHKLVTSIVCLLSTFTFVLMVAYLPPAGKDAAGVAAFFTGAVSFFAVFFVLTEP